MSLLTRDEKVLWHPYTPVPHLGPKAVFTRAAGSYVYDESGRRYFDATSSWWCITHGHCHPRLVSALTRQAAQMDQVLFSPHTHPLAVELSETLLGVLGSRFDRVFFSDDGSTAVEAAMKMAVQYWVNRGVRGRNRFLTMERAYHGDTLGAVSVSHVEEFHGYFESLRVPAYASTVPYCYRCPLGKAYPSCAIACVEKAEATLDREGDKIAALIVEPLVLGAGGMIVYPKEYLERLVKKARSKGVLVIFDEVFTGFGRTGKPFAMDHLENAPDIVCLSKGLTAGMLPLAATVATEEVYSAFTGGPEKTLYHGHTFTANALGCAVALENLKILKEERTFERNGRLVDWLASQTPRFASLDRVGDVRHLGLIWALELVESKATKAVGTPANAYGWKVAEKLWEKGFWLRPLGQMLYVVPPYSSTVEDLTPLFDLLYTELQNGEPR